MNKQEVAKYAQRLHSRVPLLGSWLRRSACRKLAENPSASVVPHLAEALHSDDSEARTHQHWLVRLACLALYDVAPQFAFADMPTGGDGGGRWIERLAPAVLDAVVYRQRAVRLNPDQLGALQAALKVGRDRRDGRWAWGRLLEALARHHLRHTIEVDERMTVEIGETAIEVDLEE